MEQLIYELKPDSKKLFISNLLKLTIIFILVFIGFLLLKNSGFITSFSEILQTFNINLSSDKIFIFIILVFIFVFFISILLSYLTLSNIRYSFYDEKLVCSQGFLGVKIKEITIPYDNIIRINFKEKGANNGDIELELSGMKNDKFVLEYISNPEEMASYIQSIIDEYKQKKYAEFTENYKRENILDRLG